MEGHEQDSDTVTFAWSGGASAAAKECAGGDGLGDG